MHLDFIFALKPLKGASGQDDYEEKWSERYLQQAASLQGEKKEEEDGKEKEAMMNPMMAMMMNPMMAMMMNNMMAGMNPMRPGFKMYAWMLNIVQVNLPLGSRV